MCLMERSISLAFAILGPVYRSDPRFGRFLQCSLALSGLRYWFNPLIKSECQSKQWPTNFGPEQMNGKMEKINRKGDLSSLSWQTMYSISLFAPLIFVGMQCCCFSWMAQRLREVPQIRHSRKINLNLNKWSHLPSWAQMTKRCPEKGAESSLPHRCHISLRKWQNSLKAQWRF